MNTHRSVLNGASAQATTPDQILRIALAAGRRGNFAEVVDHRLPVTPAHALKGKPAPQEAQPQAPKTPIAWWPVTSRPPLTSLKVSGLATPKLLP